MCLAKTSGMRFGGSAGRMGSSFSSGSSMRDSMRDAYDRQTGGSSSGNYGPSARQRDRASGYQPTGVPSNMPAPSPVRQGIMDVFGDVDVGRTDENDNLIKDPDNPYQNFMNNFRDSTGQKLNRFAGDGGIRNLSPMMALFDAFRGRGKDKSVNMTNATDRLSGQIFRQAAANPGQITLSDDGLGLNIDTGTGTIKLGSSGFATYTGTPNPDYTGVFENIVNPPDMSSDDDASSMSQPFDPCPDGFKYNAETQSCEPVDEAEDTPKTGSKFVRNPVGLSTAFPDLTRYGREGGEYQFFTEMPGVNMRDGGVARGPQGEVTGPGGPKDDLVGPFMLSSQEYVMPYEMVLEEGGGSYDRGIKALEQERMAALKKYKDRVASS